MIDSSLSRWSMAFFAVSLACLVAAEALLASGYGFPGHALEAPQTLVVVHLVAIGWLSMLMCGALFQFVPVLVAKPLRRSFLALPVLVCLTAGLACLVAGFLQLAGTLESGLPLLAFGGCLLPLGFAMAVWVLAETLWQGRPLPLPARFVAVGLACLLVLAGLGALFAHLLSGLLQADGLAAQSRRLVALHAALGLGGWLSFSAIGVSYRLLPMFMLAPDRERTTSRWAWRCGSMALLALVALAPAELALRDAVAGSFAVAGGLGLVALVLYGADQIFFYRNRRRRDVELNITAAAGAFLSLYAAALICLVLVATGTLERHVGAFAYLLVFGWLGGLGLSQLYKIVPFLTWLECYGPVMGRRPTPRVQDLVAERRDAPWFAAYFAGVFLATTALLTEAPGLFRLAAAATCLATLAIAIELVLMRRLVNVAPALRLPEGTHLPRLLMAASSGR
jgi:hypothetical protein